MKTVRIYSLLSCMVILSAAGWISSCRHETDISGLPELCFERDVLPVFSNNCAVPGCHDGTTEASPLYSYSDIRKTVVPYQPQKSQSYKAITSTRGEMQMPPGQPLSEEKRTIVRIWIEQGANETTCAP